MGIIYPNNRCDENKQITEEFMSSSVMILYDLYDKHLCFPITPLSHIATLVYINCDKNTVYYTCNPHLFPNVKRIVLFNAHPCDYDVARRFSQNVTWESCTNWKYISEETNNYTYGNHVGKEFYNIQDKIVYWRDRWIPQQEYKEKQRQFWGSVPSRIKTV